VVLLLPQRTRSSLCEMGSESDVLAGNDRTQEQQDKHPADTDTSRSIWKIHWKEPSIVIGVVGLVIAFLAFGRDLFGIEFTPDTRQTPTAEVTIASTPTPISPSPEMLRSRSASTHTVTPPGKPLTDLTPLAGGSFLKRVPGTTTFTIACATNSGGDMYRAVRFAIPRRDAATFSGQVGPAEIEDDVGVDIRVDNLIRASVTLQPGQGPSALTAEVVGGATLEVRLTCARPGGVVTFSNAELRGEQNS
jgi:hypothetical protein